MRSLLQNYPREEMVLLRTSVSTGEATLGLNERKHLIV
jgi:hypothetical protein